MWYFLKLCTTYSDLMVLTRNVILSFYLINIQLCPHQVAPPVKIMPRPFFHERGIACGTTCDKVPMAKMITVKDLSIISHSYKLFLWKIECKLKPTLKIMIWESFDFWSKSSDSKITIPLKSLFPKQLCIPWKFGFVNQIN